MNEKIKNVDAPTVAGFGDEWTRFDQSSLDQQERQALFNAYFSVFPKEILNQNSTGADFGCGSGRWAVLVAPKVQKLFCIDPSNAIDVAKKNLAPFDNCQFIQATIDEAGVADASLDFAYSLGVLHHIPQTQLAMADCVKKLKPGAPFLVYLYYAFDNRPFWFRWLWRASELVRAVCSKMPHSLRYLMSQLIAALVYFPLAKTACLLEKLGVNAQHFPLYFYRNSSFYTMRTDALDRFGTRLEQRFTKVQIQAMMQQSGLERIGFSDETPYWCAVGYRKSI